ncbi:MAG: AhpC/TSA family protein [Pedobacter sp.]|nr:MAG: AhpC/TSA family protein [Pedobacter sp.]
MKIKTLIHKRMLLALLTPALFVGVANAQTESPFSILGKIDGLGDQMVKISAQYKGQTIADSVQAKNGMFTYKGTSPGLLFYGLRLGKNGFLGIPVEAKEQVTITGELSKLNEAEIKGAKHMAVWKAWGKSWRAITSRAGELYKLSDSISKTADKDRSYVDAEFAKLNQRLVDTVEMYVKKYPASPMTAYIILDRFVSYPNPDKAKSTYAALAPAAKNSTFGKELGEAVRVAAKTGIGAKPSFSLPDRDGKALTLASQKGKIVLVDFWASWCVPCRKENPNLVKAYAKYHDKGFEIIGVSLDDKKESWNKAIEADKLVWLHASDLKGWKSDLATEFGIKSVPTSFLVDADGKVIAKDLRGEALEKKLETLFK